MKSRSTGTLCDQNESLLNNVGGVGSVGAWVRGWRESNFGVGGVVGVGP